MTMAHDYHHGPVSEGETIDPNDPAQLAKWTKELAVSEDDLRAAIEQVGAERSRIIHWFGRFGPAALRGGSAVNVSR